jgi:hypothetical protein
MTKDLIAQNAACNAVVRLVDHGTLWPSGRLYLYDSSNSVATWLPFSIPAYRDATDGTSVANMISDSTSFIDATVSWFRVMNRDATSVWTGTIGRTDHVGGDMRFDSLVFPKDSTITISSAYYAVPA